MVRTLIRLLLRTYNLGWYVFNFGIYENSFISSCYMYMFERIHAGRAIIFHNKRCYDYHNSETARSVHWIKRTIWRNWEHAATQRVKDRNEVLNERRNNDMGFMSLLWYKLSEWIANQKFIVYTNWKTFEESKHQF